MDRRRKRAGHNDAAKDRVRTAHRTSPQGLDPHSPLPIEATTHPEAHKRKKPECGVSGIAFPNDRKPSSIQHRKTTKGQHDRIGDRRDPAIPAIQAAEAISRFRKRVKEMSFSMTYVIVATMGRAKYVAKLLDQLERQSCPPAGIILSASVPTDIPPLTNPAKIEVVLGTPGLTAQRNRALARLPADARFVVFFDDDFIPSIFWLERMQQFFAQHTNAVAVTGLVLADGVKSNGIDWAAGMSIVENEDEKAAASRQGQYAVRANRSPYGCNMAYRLDAVRSQTFDERLVHYGWLEDLDFGFRAANGNRDAYWTDAMWGVHLGVRVARRSDLSFGYSQVVNPWYLLKKGAMTSLGSTKMIVQGIVQNAVKLAIGDPHFDRFDRIKGNAIGVADIVRGRWRPERASDF